MNKIMIGKLKNTAYNRYPCGARFLIVKSEHNPREGSGRHVGEMAVLEEKTSVTNSPFRLLSLRTPTANIRVGSSNRLVEVKFMVIPEDMLSMFYTDEDIFAHHLSGTWGAQAIRIRNAIENSLGLKQS